jgi:PPOX class probable F420-dependent enzyme
MSSSAKQFQGQQAVVIESYCCKDHPVLTPAPFVEKDGRLFMRAPSRTQRVDRMRQKSNVRLVPCDKHGHPLGDWVPAIATVHSELEYRWVTKALDNKYGWYRSKELLRDWLRRRGRKQEYAVIKISLAA